MTNYEIANLAVFIVVAIVAIGTMLWIAFNPPKDSDCTKK